MEWLLTNARLVDRAEPVDIAIADGRIARIGPVIPGPAAQRWDLEGQVVLPGLVDPHVHLDKTYLNSGGFFPNRSGTLLEAIHIWRAVKRQRSGADVQSAVRRALRAAIANGVTAMRSHVDTEEPADLETLAAILEVREEFRHAIDLQIVALGFAGTSPVIDRAMADALALGADLVGGAPALTPDPQASLAVIFALAERYGKPIDLHIDETEDPASRTLSALAELTIAAGMQGLVTAGHCCSLAFMHNASAGKVIERVAAAGLHIVTLPSCNLVLMGRGMQPPPRGVTRVKELLAAGVNVCAGSDNVQDLFNPFGSYDPLQTANVTAHTAHLTGTDELRACLEMVTTRAARALGLDANGLREGAPADLLVLDACDAQEAVTAPPPRLATFKNGRLIVRTQTEREWI
ncbi:MAG: amidohydrolase family protein [Chloroflexi bacterium]|nr:amidohydrolase family protein [Chloroflexota bacterium]